MARQASSSVVHLLTSTSHWLTVLRWFLVAEVLLIAAIAPLQLRPSQGILVVGLLIGTGVLVLLVKQPALGLIAIFVGGMFVPYHGPSGLNVSMILVGLLLGLWLLEVLVFRRWRTAFDLSGPIVPLIAFVVVACVSLVVGQLPWFALAPSAPLGAQWGGFSLYVLSVGALLLAAYRIPDLRWLQVTVWIFLACAALYIAARLIPLGTASWQILSLFQSRAFGSLFWVWLVALALSQALWNKTLRSYWRVLLAALVVAAFYVAYVQSGDWRSGYVPAAAGAAVLIWLRSWRLGLFLTLLGAIPAAGLLTEMLVDDEYSYSTRLDAWLIMVEIIKANPVLGLGFANYRWYTPLFPIRGYDVYFNSHNEYVDLVAQMGIVGAVCLGWLYLAIGRLGWKLRSLPLSSFSQAYVNGALAGLVGMIVAGTLGDWSLPFFYNIGMAGFRASVLGWIFLGGLMVVGRYCRSSAAPIGSSA